MVAQLGLLWRHPTDQRTRIFETRAMPSESLPRKTSSPVRIGKYKVTSHIATGGMGAVYRAIDTETQQEVALKVLTPEMAAKPGMVKRFRREGESALQLQHENIVKVFEYATCGGTSFI